MTFVVAKELGVEVRSTEIDVEAALDPAKFAGIDRSVRAGYQTIKVTINVDLGCHAGPVGGPAGRGRGALSGQRQHRTTRRP